MKILEDSLLKFENVNNLEKRQFVISSVRVYLSLFLLFFFTLLIPFVSAELGCCFDSSNGFCSPGTESNLCSGNNVEFFPSATCAVNECNQGCCNLGTDFPFITARECELRAEQKGFEFDWQEMDQDSCRLLELSSQEGACRLGTYGDKCKITTRDKCTSGDFTADKNCVDLKIYNQTTNTMCYKDSVYFKDTAGNPANISAICNYDAGTICKEKSANNAYCADINCNGKKNGESWCSFDSADYINMEDFYSRGLSGDGEISWAPVGSRFFRKYCSNGEIYIEPCADYRMEFCDNGKCVINKGDECLAANTINKETGESELDEESCNGDYCYTFIPTDCVASGGQNFCGDNRNNYKHSGSPDADEFASEPLKALNLNICAPRIPLGIDLSSSQIASSSSEESIGVCSVGNYQSAELQFGYHGPKDVDWGQWNPIPQWDSHNDWYYSPPAGKTYGYIAFAGPLYNAWDWSAENPSSGPWKIKSFVDGDYDEIMDSAVESGSMESSGKVVSLLGERCTVISDCAGKTNWVGGSGVVTGETILNFGITGNAATPAYRDRSNKNSDTDDLEVSENFEGSGGAGGGSSGGSMSMSGDKRDPVFTFDGYTCGTYSAPSSGDCSQCGADKLACSEYRCKAIGKSCEYKELSGVDRGYCVSSNDKSAPSISLKGINPPSPVEPYSPVEISIKTNEASECRFSLNGVPAKYGSMKYSFGDGFGFEHSVKLNLPGQIAGLRGNITEYPLLTSDGKYKMYVRCLDASGNGEAMPPFTINFEVMKTPDTKILPPRNFNPIAGNPIKYNTTSRFVTFEMLEPSECRWAFSDMVYENMNGSFSCDASISINPTKNYICSGILTNITANKTIKYEQQIVCAETLSGEVCREQTVAVTGISSEGKKFYIRCKDQPELENDTVIIKNVSYSRNIMQTSFVYELRNSDALKINSISPNGKVSLGSSDVLELSAFTNSGANNGKAQCYFKISNKSDFSGASYTLFKSTNSTEHRHQINPALIYGFNYVNVKCIDSADNVAYLNSTFNLALDKTSPKAISLAKLSDNLRIRTDESAKCYYSFDNIKRCLFAKENSTEMQTNDGYSHSASWENDKTFYIKCEDARGNLAGACTIAVDTRAYVG